MIKLIAARWPAKFSKETRQRWLLMVTRRRLCGLQEKEKWPSQSVCTPCWQDRGSKSNLNTTFINRHVSAWELTPPPSPTQTARRPQAKLVRWQMQVIWMVTSQHFRESNLSTTTGDARGAKPIRYTSPAFLLCWPRVTWMLVSYRQVGEPQNFEGPNSWFSSRSGIPVLTPRQRFSVQSVPIKI